MIIGNISVILLVLVVVFLPIESKSYLSYSLFIIFKCTSVLALAFVFFGDFKYQEFSVMFLVAFLAVFIGHYFSGKSN